MRRIVHFLNIAILAFFASCIILLFGGIEYRAADLMQPIDYQESPNPIDEDEYIEELNPRSDYYLPHNEMFQEARNSAIIYL